MFRKIKILSIAFIMFLSNVAFSATSACSFVATSNFINKESKIDVVKQCRGIVNMPKVFCNICVELTEEINNFSNENRNNSSINKEYNYNDIIGNIEAVENNNKRQKTIYIGSTNNLNGNDKKSNNRLLCLNNEKPIYYITDYIGLLHANDVTNAKILIKNTDVKPLLVV